MNWDKIWDDYRDWFERRGKESTCSKCGQLKSDYPDWDEQQRYIQRRVNKAIKDGSNPKENK